MIPDDALYRIALKHIPLVGAVIARNLISYCGSPAAVFNTPRSRLLRIPGVGQKIADNIVNRTVLDCAQRELEHIHRAGIDMHFFLDDTYPGRLRSIVQAPVLLYSRGLFDMNTQRIVAIVGTRSPTQYGREACSRIVKALAPYSPLILSGLAYGVDIAAHREALRHGLPTVAVMGSGFGYIYPAQHRREAKAMLKSGGLISEFSYDTKPDRENFPARNRIVAALADVVVVIESGESGGSMITAEFANGYDREVCAIPGRFIDDRSAGCNRLIKQHKAHLVESGEEIIALMNWEKDDCQRPEQSTLFADLSEPERLILELMASSVEMQNDDLLRRAKMTASQLATVLLSLELKGVVRALPGKRYIKIS